MTNNERLPVNHEHEHINEELQEAAEKSRERLAEQRNEKAKTSHEHDVEATRHEALEKATQHEKEQRDKEQIHEKAPTVVHRPNTKVQRKAAFDTEMRQVQSRLSPTSRMFSKVIHNPAVEKTSEVLGSTVARPNAILSGAVFAFILTLGVYITARFFGYPLSGSETIVAFVLGWVIGCMYDFFRVMITGKKA